MLIVLFLSVSCGLVSSLYFHIEDTKKKCFIQDVPDRTRLVGEYWTQLYDEQRDEYLPVDQHLRVHVVATDPEDQLVLSGSHGSAGRFTFTSLRAGEHELCLQCDSSQRPLSAGGLLALHLDVRAGEHTNNYAQIAAEQKLTELQLRVRQLTEQIRQIQREQDYHRLRLNDLREVNLSTNRWVFWWVLIRTLYMVAVISWNSKW